LGLFHGACQGFQVCGASAILFLNNSHYFTLKFGAGQGTNNRVEFYALWILLKVAGEKNVSRLQVLGDSKLLMDWENGKNQITNMALSPIMELCLEKKKIFEEISFSHVYREFNYKADKLSKEALILQEGHLIEQEFRDNIPLDENPKVTFLMTCSFLFSSMSFILSKSQLFFSKIPNHSPQIVFHFDVDFLVVSSLFMPFEGFP
jgi:ribonuclease HI